MKAAPRCVISPAVIPSPVTASRQESAIARARVDSEKEESLNIIMLDEDRILCWLFQGIGNKR